MRKVIVLAGAAHGATWTTQSSTIPGFGWTVVDHESGNSMGYGITVAADSVWVSGSMSETLRLRNPATGAAVESADQGTDGDIYLGQVSTEGEPRGVWVFSGALNGFPSHLASSADDAYISMTGYFAGNFTFGDFTLNNPKDGSTATHERELDDGFVLKVSTVDGTVEWAVHVAADGGATCAGTSFDASDNVAVVGQRCEAVGDDGEGTECAGYVSLLASGDGSEVWHVDMDETVSSLSDVVVSDGSVYVVGSVLGTLEIGDLTVSSAARNVSDALLLVLDATDGTPLWSATITGPDHSSSSLVEVLDDSIYLSCGGGCLAVASSASAAVATMDGLMTGGVAKITTSGEPLWGADVPSPLGMAVTADAVYLNFHATGPDAYGDETFSAWGSFDQFIVKVDSETGAGDWVLQQGGHGLEYVRRMAVDDAGDLYSIGLTSSDPSYFDPIELGSHNNTDGYDVFIAKLATSDEQLPSCKTDASTVADGYCFVNNVCYDEGDVSRAESGEACLVCSPDDDQLALTLHGGYELDATGACAIIAIAGYVASTDVSTHSMIDLDAKEIEELSDAADWETALFVYENGGNGLCSEEDIATTDESDSCFGKTTADAKGNSIKGSGEIRTIHGFATSGREKMAAQRMWNLYRDYWDDDNYADTFIRNALAADGAWSSRSDALRAELSAKGAKYQAVWMYVIHEMEDAVADCLAGDIFDNQASNAAGDSPHAWDEAWAFYAGSLEGTDGSGKGYLLYDLAEKRCPQFGTCGSTGGAIANEKALEIANAGLQKILAADCAGVDEELDKMVVQMTIPVIQGMVRYLYLADPAVNGGSCSDGVCTYDKEWAEGWAFAVAILPLVDQCDSSVAELLVSNLDIDATATPMSDGYEYVKGQFETTYACLGVTCADIGEYQDDDGVVYPGMEACTDTGTTPTVIYRKKKSTKINRTPVIALAACLGVMCIVALGLAIWLRITMNKLPSRDFRYARTKNSLIIGEVKDDDSLTTGSDHVELS